MNDWYMFIIILIVAFGSWLVAAIKIIERIERQANVAIEEMLDEFFEKL